MRRRIDWSGVPFGSAPDTEIARMVGCTAPAVAYQRKKRGIESHRAPADEMPAGLEWRPINRFPDYDISERGDVRKVRGRIASGRIRKAHVGDRGYVYIRFKPKGSRTLPSVRLHRLVAEAFLGPIPDGMEVNHRDGNKLNNHYSNLEYMTRLQNVRHSFAHGLNRSSKLDPDKVREIRRRAANGEGSKVLGRAFGVCRKTIVQVRRREIWRDVE